MSDDNPYRLTYRQLGNTFVGDLRFVYAEGGVLVEEVLICGLGAMGVGCMWFGVSAAHRKMRGYRLVRRGWYWDPFFGWRRRGGPCSKHPRRK